MRAKREIEALRKRIEDLEERCAHLEYLRRQDNETFDDKVEYIMQSKMRFQVIERMQDYEKGKKAHKALKMLEDVYEGDEK